MENLFFYPTLTPELVENAGISVSQYTFSYYFDNEFRELRQNGRNTVKLEDSLESWKIENDGLHIVRDISIEYPEVLLGEHGIACRDAKIGYCIRWINKSLTHRGIIYPKLEGKNGEVLHVSFEYDFEPKTIKGDLELQTVLYIKKTSDNVESSEQHLINDSGVVIGVLDDCRIDFGSIYMDFPIQEINSKEQPLWWLELGDWEDPTQEPFNEDNVRIYLNSAYSCCPQVGDVIKNVDVLIDIISTAYTMILNKIEEMGYLSRTINDVNLEAGSISKIMCYFLSGCNVDTSSLERMHKTIWLNVASVLKGGDDE